LSINTDVELLGNTSLLQNVTFFGGIELNGFTLAGDESVEFEGTDGQDSSGLFDVLRIEGCGTVPADVVASRIVMSSFFDGPSGRPLTIIGNALTWSQGNFNGDNIVDSRDLNQIGTHWRESIALALSVPELCFNWELLLLTCAACLVRRFPSMSP
jgi:hypothetical protein